jgi:Eco47II restriction endonuclease
MSNYGLCFISDVDLFNHVKDTVEKYRFTINLEEFNQNIVDPIKLTFDAKVYEKSIYDVIEFEILRQLDKSNTNHIGYFHQNIFNYIGDDWHVPKSGFDIINETQKVYVEMKNKHNTMNSNSSQKIYLRMQATLLIQPTATCMLVEVIATKSQNTKWVISLDGVRFDNDRIRRVSIDKFYALVTGESDAFRQLCEKIPKVIDDVVKAMDKKAEANTVLSELKAISPNILQSVYLSAFKKYQGFADFELQ